LFFVDRKTKTKTKKNRKGEFLKNILATLFNVMKVNEVCQASE